MATEGEWVARPDPRDNGEWEVIVWDDGKPTSDEPWYVATCFPAADGATAEDNAKSIVRSVNSHYALVEALELMCRHADDVQSISGGTVQHSDLLVATIAAREALALASKEN